MYQTGESKRALFEAKWFTNQTGLLCLLMIGVAVPRLVSIYSFYLYDDAFISFRYIANLVAGNGYVYNLGERVQGITCPLWGMLLAVPTLIGLPLEISSRMAGLLFDLAAIGLVAREFCRVGRTEWIVGVGFLFAIDLYLAKVSVSGMESSFFLAGTLAASVLALNGKYKFAAVIGALCYFIRPEALLFLVSMTAFVWYETRRAPVIPILIGLSVVMAGVFVEYSYYGSLIPQSVKGKMAVSGSFGMLWDWVIFPLRDPLQAILTITMLVGLPIAWKASRLVRLYGIWTGLLFGAWVLTNAHLWTWYCVPVYFYKTLVSGIAAMEWLSRLRTKPATRFVLSPVLLTVFTIMVWGTVAVVLGRDKMEINVYSKIREWAQHQRFTDSHGTLLTAYGMDYGAFGYYTRLRIVDEPGLVYPLSLEKYGCDLRTILKAEKPEYAFVTCYRENIGIMCQPDIADVYKPVWRISVTGDTVIPDNPDRLRSDWSADFVLYKRFTGNHTSQEY
jgi:hypothetical protein